MVELLNFEVAGESNHQKIVLIAHGLFGSHKNWRSIAKLLVSLGYQVISVDMRNHGLSFWHDSHRYVDLANDLRRVITKFGGAADIIGHSMGGKAAMALALLHSHCVKKLVVVDIAPVYYERSQLEYINAMEAVNLNLVKTRNDLDKELSVGIDDPTLRNFFSQSFDFSRVIRKNWLLNLKALKQNLPEIMDFPTFQHRNFSPTLIVRGSLSNYVLDKHQPVINDYFPNYRLLTIDKAGHWLHVSNRKEFSLNLSQFLMS